MREILFRGKRKDNGECVEGYFVKQTIDDNTEYYIVEERPKRDWVGFGLSAGFEHVTVMHKVYPETIEQCTGSADVLGNKIFVPIGFSIGVSVYFLLEDDFPEHKFYFSEEKVTEVCSKGFFVSSFLPAEGDLGNYTPWEELGKTVFLTEKEAKSAVLKQTQRKKEKI